MATTRDMILMDMDKWFRDTETKHTPVNELAFLNGVLSATLRKPESSIQLRYITTLTAEIAFRTAQLVYSQK